MGWGGGGGEAKRRDRNVTNENWNTRAAKKITLKRGAKDRHDPVSFPVTVSRGGRHDDSAPRLLLDARKTNANGRNAFERSHVDPITVATRVDGCHRPLVGTRISNPVSVITAPETSS